MPSTLTDLERDVLDFAGKEYKYPDVREHHATVQLGISGIFFWQLLNQLLDRQDALAYAPQTVYRWRARRTHRKAAS